MPRKKKSADNQQPDGTAAVNGSAAEAPAKRKRASRRKPAAAKAAAENVDVAPPELSDEAIRLRAYFIAEERLRRALPGDAEADWLEARRQLLSERGES